MGVAGPAQLFFWKSFQSASFYFRSNIEPNKKGAFRPLPVLHVS